MTPQFTGIKKADRTWPKKHECEIIDYPPSIGRPAYTDVKCVCGMHIRTWQDDAEAIATNHEQSFNSGKPYVRE